jgi:predicted ATPase
LHEQTAQAIEQLYHDKLDEQYDELAHHYQRSGNVDKAVHYLHKAGQRAVLRSANVEAIIHLNAALALLNSLPQTSERDQQELALLITLGPVLTAVKGWTAPEVERTYTRAQELCRQIGETPQLFPVLVGLAGFYGLRSKLDMAQQLANQCFNLAQQDSRPDLLLEAHHVLGYTLFALGELVDSQAHLERGFTYYDFRKYQSQPELYVQGHDPGICCSANGAYALGVLGYPDQAVRKMKSAITLARDLSHPLSLAVALFWSALLYQFRREPFEAQKSIDGLQATSREHGFPSSFTIGMILQGGELAKHGQQEEGIAQMCQALADQRDMGTEQWRPYSLALLGEAYGDAGQLEKGLNVLAEALELVRTTGERSYEAELYRLKGELLLKQAEKLKA